MIDPRDQIIECLCIKARATGLLAWHLRDAGKSAKQGRLEAYYRNHMAIIIVGFALNLTALMLVFTRGEQGGGGSHSDTVHLALLAATAASALTTSSTLARVQATRFAAELETIAGLERSSV